MEAVIQHTEEQTDRRSSIISLILFLLLLIGLIVPIFSYTIPPPEEEGILISFGEPDVGSGQDAPEVQSTNPTQTKSEAAKTEQKVESKEKPQEQPKETPVAKAPAAKVLTSKIDKEIIVPKSTQKSPEVSAAELQAQREATARAEAEAAAAAAAKAEAEKQAKFEQSKKQFGEFLSGSGKGETSTSGNQGDPKGDPNASALTGISTGSGRIGGGLADRGLLYEPEVKDKSQKTGKVVMKVCVDNQGKVTEATFTQRGSTTVDGELREKAQRAANRYKFTASEVEEQCGTITFDFKVE